MIYISFRKFIKNIPISFCSFNSYLIPISFILRASRQKFPFQRERAPLQMYLRAAKRRRGIPNTSLIATLIATIRLSLESTRSTCNRGWFSSPCVRLAGQIIAIDWKGTRGSTFDVRGSEGTAHEGDATIALVGPDKFPRRCAIACMRRLH